MCPITSSNMMGFFPPGSAWAENSLSVNTAAYRMAFSVPILASGKTVTKFRCQLQSTTGSPIAADISCSIYIDDANTGVPSGAALATATASSIPAALAYIDFTFNQALSASTQYWFVVSNLNAVPGTNYFAIRQVNACKHPMFTPPRTFGFGDLYSTNSGTGWNALGYGDIPNWFCAFSDGSNSGTLITNMAAAVDVAGAAKEWGMVFTTPTGGKMRVKGATFQIVVHGTVAANAFIKIYNGSTLVATSVRSRYGTLALYCVSAWFDAPVILDSATVYRITLSIPGVNGTSNYLSCAGMITVEDTVLSKSLKPFNGTISSTTTTDGANFTDDTTRFPTYGIMLDQSNEIGPDASVNTDPGIANVRSGTAYTAASAPVTGTLDLPAVAAVKTGTVFDNTLQTGTYTGADRWTTLAPTDVRGQTAYKSNSTTNNQTGILTGSVRVT